MKAILLIIVLIIAGCGTYEAVNRTVEWEGPNGSRGKTTTVINTPTDSIEPVIYETIPSVTGVPGIAVNGGAVQPLDKALEALSKNTSWLALLMVIAGVASIIGRAWLPFLPVTASVVLLAAGAGLYAFPLIVDRYAVYVLIGVIGAAGLYVYGIWDNKKLLNKEPTKTKTAGDIINGNSKENETKANG